MSAAAQGPGWSGGQYSLARTLLALCLIGLCLRALAAAGPETNGRLACFPNLLVAPVSPVWILPGALAVVCGLLLAIGRLDRIGAAGLGYLWFCLLDARVVPVDAPSILIGAPLAAHLFLPPAPYGSWAARGRADPGAGWRMPGWIHRGLWICLALGYAHEGLSKLLAQENPVELVVVPLALWPHARRWLWVGLAVAELVAVPFAGSFRGSLGPLLILVYTFDPAWVKAPSEGPDTLFYDGGCGLCHRWVRFLLAEDEGGRAFRFAPLQGAVFASRIPEGRRSGLPDSLVLCRPDGSLLVRSAAVRHILRRLGGLWTALGIVSGVLPAVLSDRAYGAVAAVRHRLFRKPATSCPVVPPHLAARFVDE